MAKMAPTNILVVENDRRVRDRLATLIELEDYVVYKAADPEEALQKLEEDLIHLAIVDIRLREEDDATDQSGLDLCAQMDPTVARLIITAYPEEWSAIRASLSPIEGRRQLADGFLYKGELDHLIPEIKRVLKEQFEILPRRRIAVLTSGGDASGMNAAIWSVVRIAMGNNMEVMGIHDGYRGLVEDRMHKLAWNEVSDILVLGGTYLGAARCPEFVDRAIRARSVDNLLRKHITGLVVIGGDGSMQGAKALAADVQARGRSFQTVAIPGTIDNDLWGTDMSLGAASAANAMIEELRNMIRPAQALGRIFVGEVSGRYSGYLTLEAALGIGADAVILPEQVVEVRPPTGPKDSRPWKERVHQLDTRRRYLEEIKRIGESLEAAFAAGKRYGFVVLAEGIGQLTGDELNGAYVRRLLEDQIKNWGVRSRPEVREHILGYPVRGGPPCRFDIWLGAKLGAAAVESLLEPGKTDLMVGWSDQDGIVETPFDQVVAKSNRPPQEVWQDRPKWREALELLEALACPPTLQGR
jgi:6-phosphofructokinase 1